MFIIVLGSEYEGSNPELKFVTRNKMRIEFCITELVLHLKI